jgi:murein hydrolase activator
MSAPGRRLCATYSLTAGALLLSSAAFGQGFDPYSATLGVLETQLGQSQLKLEQSRRRKAELAETLTGLGPMSEQARDRLQKNARALYRVSRGGMLPVAGGMAALLGHASRVSRLEQVVQRDLQTVRQLGGEAAALRRQLAELDAQIAAGERELSALEQSRVGAARERVVHGTFQDTFSVAAAPQVAPHAQYGLSVVGGATSERFSEQRGNLALPVSGPSSIRDATRAESDGPGLEFVANVGASVRAAAAGRVAFAEPYGSYGKLVIIEHGERYYTVYGGLGQLEVQVGDDLSKSAQLGSASTEPVYFEVRRGTKTQDVRLWLGL